MDVTLAVRPTGRILDADDFGLEVGEGIEDVFVPVVLRQVLELRVALRQLLVALVERVGLLWRKNREVGVEERAQVTQDEVVQDALFLAAVLEKLPLASLAHCEASERHRREHRCEYPGCMKVRTCK